MIEVEIRFQGKTTLPKCPPTVNMWVIWLIYSILLQEIVWNYLVQTIHKHKTELKLSLKTKQCLFVLIKSSKDDLSVRKNSNHALNLGKVDLHPHSWFCCSSDSSDHQSAERKLCNITDTQRTGNSLILQNNVKNFYSRQASFSPDETAEWIKTLC